MPFANICSFGYLQRPLSCMPMVGICNQVYRLFLPWYLHTGVNTTSLDCAPSRGCRHFRALQRIRHILTLNPGNRADALCARAVPVLIRLVLARGRRVAAACAKRRGREPAHDAAVRAALARLPAPLPARCACPPAPCHALQRPGARQGQSLPAEPCTAAPGCCTRAWICKEWVIQHTLSQPARAGYNTVRRCQHHSARRAENASSAYLSRKTSCSV